jgi:hypothetical protein
VAPPAALDACVRALLRRNVKTLVWDMDRTVSERREESLRVEGARADARCFLDR